MAVGDLSSAAVIPRAREGSRVVSRVLPVLAGAAALPLAAITAVTAATSEHLPTPGASAVFLAYNVCTAMLIGMVWCVRRPASRFGPLLIVYGAVWWVTSWMASDVAVLYYLGAIAQVPVYVLTYVVCLAFPLGALAGRGDRIVVTILTCAVVLALPIFLFQPAITGGGPFTVCAGACPANPFAVLAEPVWYEPLNWVRGLAITAAPVVVAVLYGIKLRGASPPHRRALATVAVGTLPLLCASFAYQLSRRVLDAGPGVLDLLSWFVFAGRIVFPLAFLVALVQSELSAQAAMRGLLAGLAGDTTLSRWREALARALHDPSAELAVYNAGARRFVDPEDRPVERPAPGSGRVWVPVGERPVAAIVTDEALLHEPELTAAAAEATLVALRTEDLARDVRESRARILEAGDAARERLVRDLHDSAQQRLVALRMRLGADGDERTKAELDGALEELRAVAHGLYPPLLSRYGVGPSLRAVARAGAIPATVADGEASRHPRAVESCAYFCCLEALQNAAKHGGPGASVAIVLADREGGLEFVVRDDGAGFDAERVVWGAGLTSIADRVAAAGGTLELESHPGRGTRIAGRIPAAP